MKITRCRNFSADSRACPGKHCLSATSAAVSFLHPLLGCRGAAARSQRRSEFSTGRFCCPHRTSSTAFAAALPPAWGSSAAEWKLCRLSSGACPALGSSPSPSSWLTCAALALATWPSTHVGNTISQQVTGAEFPCASCARPSRWLWLQTKQQSGAKELQTKGFYLLVINAVQLNQSEIIGS